MCTIFGRRRASDAMAVVHGLLCSPAKAAVPRKIAKRICDHARYCRP